LIDDIDFEQKKKQEVISNSL